MSLGTGKGNQVVSYNDIPQFSPPIVTVSNGVIQSGGGGGGGTNVTVGNLTPTMLPNNAVKYVGNIASTGSSAYVRFYVSNAHSLRRVEVSQVTTSSNALDNTGLAASWSRVNNDAPVYGASDIVLANQPTIANANIVFAFENHEYEFEPVQYDLTFTGQNNDTIIFILYLQYL